MVSIGFIALARPTFDVAFAEETAAKALAALRSSIDRDVIGSAEPTMDVDAVQRVVSDIASSGPDAMVVFQATFADSTLVRAVSEGLECPLVLWAVPEDRTGGRLRLNSFCGINLAAYVLAREGVDYRWVYRSVGDPRAPQDLQKAINGPTLSPDEPATPLGTREAPTLAGMTVGLVGSRPEGFEPCDYDEETLRSLFGVEVDRVDLDEWFSHAQRSEQRAVARVRAELGNSMTGIDEVDQVSLERSLRLYLGLSDLAENRGWRGVATRCWPECFTEFGGAACAGNSMLSSRGIPGCCEADVYGDVTALLLRELSDEPPLVADLVDLDRESNTAAFWHCGLGPKELAAQSTKPRATIHSNRQKPLLNEFALKPGRVTIARLSQSQNQTRMLIGGAEMLDVPLPFSGTSGVASLDSDVDRALETIMGNGLEHHYGIAYGDHRDGLASYAASVGLAVIEL